jgi:hypothetical protein
MDTTVSPLSVWRISKSLHPHLLFSSAGELLEQLVGLQRFDPVKAATWPKGESAPLSFVSAQLKVVEDRLSSPVMRHRAQDTLCNLFRTLIVTSPADLVSLVCLLRDQVRNYLSSLAAQHYHTSPERSTLGWMASLLGHAGQSRQHRGTREEERERGWEERERERERRREGEREREGDWDGEREREWEREGERKRGRDGKKRKWKKD